MSIRSDFWNERARVHGHTGWSNAVIYAYDQQARLKAVEAVLKVVSPITHDLALDFGTGSGDFARMLAKQYTNVIAFDISNRVIEVAKKNHGGLSNVQFRSGDTILDLSLSHGKFDLILSVTVLDHIVDDIELHQTLDIFDNLLKESGKLVALEYALDKSEQACQSSYQKFRNFCDWSSLFNPTTIHSKIND